MEDNIEIGFKEVRWRDIDWIELAEDKDRSGPCDCCNNLRIP
jgi:hypothetical protein